MNERKLLESHYKWKHTAAALVYFETLVKMTYLSLRWSLTTVQAVPELLGPSDPSISVSQ